MSNVSSAEAGQLLPSRCRVRWTSRNGHCTEPWRTLEGGATSRNAHNFTMARCVAGSNSWLDP
eukprot:2268958-Prymnesium_polylepis.2